MIVDPVEVTVLSLRLQEGQVVISEGTPRPIEFFSPIHVHVSLYRNTRGNQPSFSGLPEKHLVTCRTQILSHAQLVMQKMPAAVPIQMGNAAAVLGIYLCWPLLYMYF